MKKYIIYDKTTGKINQLEERTDDLTSEDIEHLDNVDFIEGEANSNTHKINIDTKEIVEIVLTSEEVTANEKLEDDNKWINLRLDRDALLQDSDWLMSISDSPLSTSKTEEWKTYRQTLRDLPSNTSDIDNINWPNKPT